MTVALGTGRKALHYQELEEEGMRNHGADIVLGMQTRVRDIPTSVGDEADSLAGPLCAVASRDRQAFETVYTATVGRVLGLATRIVGDNSAAEDVASDVYLQVWRQADRFDPERGSAIAWIMTIARSRAIDSKRRAETSATKNVEAGSSEIELDEQASLYDLVEVTNRESSLHRALQQLDASDRQLLALAYFKGYTHKQLAKITNEPLGTVKTRIRRTLIKLRGLMADDCTGTGVQT